MAERQQQQIARINELSALARTSWLVLLAYLSYTGITLLAVQDADFFVPSRRTELPLVGVAIPTFSFFVFAPPLGAALYTHLHIYLLKLFDALATAPARIDGEELGNHIHPWLANDLFLTMRADGSASSRPLRVVSNFASILLIWVAAPLVLAGFWWRSMPAHEEWLTLFLALNLLVATYAGFSSWWGAFSAAKRVFRRPWSKPWRSVWRVSAGLVTALIIVGLSGVRTEWSIEHYANRFIDWSEKTLDREFFEDERKPFGLGEPAAVVQARWVASRFGFAKIDLSGVEMVPLPESWRYYKTARSEFRERWCQREGLSMAVCDHPPSPERPAPVTLVTEREKWCARLHDLPEEKCMTRFRGLHERFERVWDMERSAMLRSLARLDLVGRDLRGAQAVGVSLVNADLAGAQLKGADLEWANLEGADFKGAHLEGAVLRGAHMEGADLKGAHMEGADLKGAHLEGADLIGAYLEGADLTGAHLEGADLIGAHLEGAGLTGAHLEDADLRVAHLEGANLGDAHLQGANFNRTYLEGADLRAAHLERANLRAADLKKVNLFDSRLDWALLHGADLRGVKNLSQSQLDKAIGNAHTLLPNGLAPDTGESYYIWDCSKKPPPKSEEFLPWRIYNPDNIRWGPLCGDRLREPSGTPLHLDAPLPVGHPLEFEF